MSQQPLTLRRAARVVRRYKLLVCGSVIAGMVLGVGYAELNPAMMSSSALVIIPTPRPNIATDTLIGHSQPVLSGALSAIGGGTTLEVLTTEVSIQQTTPSVISFNAKAGSAGEAEKIANAVASSYVAYLGSKNSPVGHVQAQVFAVASSASGSGTTKNLVIYGSIGLLVGLLGGYVLALRRGRGDHRMQDRDEIAGSVGIPVVLSLPVEVPTDAAGWLKLFDGYAPGAVHAWRLRVVLDRLGVTSDRPADGRAGTSLAILSLSSDRKAIALGPQLAAFSASLGIPTAFVVSAPQEAETTTALRAACASGTRLQGGNLLLVVDNGEGIDGRVSRARLTVVVTPVEAESKQLPAVTHTTVAVLGVSAGAVTAEELARTAAVAADSGSSIAGIMVADPDPDDKTTGLVPRPTRSTRRLPTKHATVREVRSGDRTRPADRAVHATR
ncbi:MAG: Chain length determinant protein [Actinomycetia bacterium]|nr:Chain length determinant protein [Actinomycetes bacterium]